jgi:hypothetical protein
MLFRRYSDATLTLFWRYSDATLTLLWRYSGIWRFSDATLTLLWRFSDATFKIVLQSSGDLFARLVSDATQVSDATLVSDATIWYFDATLTLLWRYFQIVLLIGLCQSSGDLFAWLVLPVRVPTMLGFEWIRHFHIGREMLSMFNGICRSVFNFTFDHKPK